MLEHVVKIWQFYSFFLKIRQSRAIFSQKSFLCVKIIIFELNKCKITPPKKNQFYIIGEYFTTGYRCLLMIVILMPIGGYSTNGYW
jgi:hypothetical protein